MKLSEEQFDALLNYIDSRISEKIQDAFGRDALNESITCSEFKKELIDVLVTTKNDE